MEYGIYHGCGNSFLIGHYQSKIDYHFLSQNLCENHRTDGLILVKLHPLTMIIYNADGSVASMCGNGIRCFSKFIYDNNITSKLAYDVQTLAGTIKVKIKSIEPFIVAVNLGKPNYTPKALGININKLEFINYPLENIKVSAVFLGTDHAIIFGCDYPIAEKISKNPIFTKGINVNFVEVIDKKHLYVKTFERGVGWTLACGTGVSSSFCVSSKLGLVDDEVEVDVDGGKLIVYKDCEDIILEGPAVTIKEAS